MVSTSLLSLSQICRRSARGCSEPRQEIKIPHFQTKNRQQKTMLTHGLVPEILTEMRSTCICHRSYARLHAFFALLDGARFAVLIPHNLTFRLNRHFRAAGVSTRCEPADRPSWQCPRGFRRSSYFFPIEPRSAVRVIFRFSTLGVGFPCLEYGYLRIDLPHASVQRKPVPVS